MPLKFFEYELEISLGDHTLDHGQQIPIVEVLQKHHVQNPVILAGSKIECMQICFDHFFQILMCEERCHILIAVLKVHDDIRIEVFVVDWLGIQFFGGKDNFFDHTRNALESFNVM